MPDYGQDAKLIAAQLKEVREWQIEHDISDDRRHEEVMKKLNEQDKELALAKFKLALITLGIGTLAGPLANFLISKIGH